MALYNGRGLSGIVTLSAFSTIMSNLQLLPHKALVLKTSLRTYKDYISVSIITSRLTRQDDCFVCITARDLLLALSDLRKSQ